MGSGQHTPETHPAPQLTAERGTGSAEGAEPAWQMCGTCSRQFGEGARFCPFDGEPLEAAPGVHPDPLVGTIVDGRYRVQSVLGEGGMGTVYRVSHVTLSRDFALKALRADLAREGDLAERFLREARSAAAISHANVCEITDFGSLHDGRPYFAMELLRGKPLGWWLERGGPMPVGPGVRIVRQIASVLQEAHEHGIVHRDLKPENVIVVDATTGEGVKVVDFGLAQVAGQSRLTRPGVVFGTPHYMSPEQAMGGTVDHRADIYSLGIVMYELFTGRVPFEADTYMGVLTKHMYAAPTPPSEVLESTKELGALEDVILRCLEKAPERRYQRMLDLVAELDSLLTRSLDGGVLVTPRRNRRLASISQFPQLADELELPSASEAQRGQTLARVRTRRLPIVLGVVGTLLGIALLYWPEFGDSETTPAPAAVAVPEAASPQESVTRPPFVPPPATLVHTAGAEESVGTETARAVSADEKAAERPPNEESQLPRSTRAVPIPTRSSESARRPEKKPDLAVEEIVDPWQK